MTHGFWEYCSSNWTWHDSYHSDSVCCRHWASGKEPEAGSVRYYAEGHEEYKGQASVGFPRLLFLQLALTTGAWKVRCSKTATLSPMIKKTTHYFLLLTADFRLKAIYCPLDEVCPWVIFETWFGVCLSGSSGPQTQLSFPSAKEQ